MLRSWMLLNFAKHFVYRHQNLGGKVECCHSNWDPLQDFFSSDHSVKLNSHFEMYKTRSSGFHHKLYSQVVFCGQMT